MAVFIYVTKGESWSRGPQDRERNAAIQKDRGLRPRFLNKNTSIRDSYFIVAVSFLFNRCVVDSFEKTLISGLNRERTRADEPWSTTSRDWGRHRVWMSLLWSPEYRPCRTWDRLAADVYNGLRNLLSAHVFEHSNRGGRRHHNRCVPWKRVATFVTDLCHSNIKLPDK